MNIQFRPDLHPRNRLGRFIEILGSLKPGDSVGLPNGVKVQSRGRGTFRVSGGQGRGKAAPRALGGVVDTQSASGAARMAFATMPPQSPGAPTLFGQMSPAEKAAQVQRVRDSLLMTKDLPGKGLDDKKTRRVLPPMSPGTGENAPLTDRQWRQDGITYTVVGARVGDSGNTIYKVSNSQDDSTFEMKIEDMGSLDIKPLVDDMRQAPPMSPGTSGAMDTPWGKTDGGLMGNGVTELSPDVIYAMTPGHGGIGVKIGSDSHKRLSPESIKFSEDWSHGLSRMGGYQWFEEDGAPAVLAKDLPELFPSPQSPGTGMGLQNDLNDLDSQAQDLDSLVGNKYSDQLVSMTEELRKFADDPEYVNSTLEDFRLVVRDAIAYYRGGRDLPTRESGSPDAYKFQALADAAREIQRKTRQAPPQSPGTGNEWAKNQQGRLDIFRSGGGLRYKDKLAILDAAPVGSDFTITDASTQRLQAEFRKEADGTWTQAPNSAISEPRKGLVSDDLPAPNSNGSYEENLTHPSPQSPGTSAMRDQMATTDAAQQTDNAMTFDNPAQAFGQASKARAEALARNDAGLADEWQATMVAAQKAVDAEQVEMGLPKPPPMGVGMSEGDLNSMELGSTILVKGDVWEQIGVGRWQGKANGTELSSGQLAKGIPFNPDFYPKSPQSPGTGYEPPLRVKAGGNQVSQDEDGFPVNADVSPAARMRARNIPESQIKDYLGDNYTTPGEAPVVVPRLQTGDSVLDPATGREGYYQEGRMTGEPSIVWKAESGKSEDETVEFGYEGELDKLNDATGNYEPWWRNGSSPQSPGTGGLQDKPIRGLADEIRADWKNVNFAAAPYLDAMNSLDSIDDQYFQDNGRSIVSYFLSNATGWRGEKAKEIKAELKRRLGR